MVIKQSITSTLWKRQYLFFLSFLTTTIVLADTNNPCGGDNALLAIMNRPTAADSVCIVPHKKTLLEMGYFGLTLIEGGQIGHTIPNPTLRVGVLKDEEFLVTPTNYNVQTSPNQAGFGPTTLGWKHFIGYDEHWVGSIEVLVTPPSGDANFGSAGYGVTLNPIVEYNFTSKLGLTFMASISTETDPKNSGGGRYNSFNPDFVLTYQPHDKWQLFVECYGQTKATSYQGSGFNIDGGIQYLVTSNFLIDAEYGQRLYGVADNFNNYVGVGLGWMF